MSLAWAVAETSALILFFALFFVFGSIHYRKENGNRFKPTSYFPYEQFMGQGDYALTLARIFSGAFLISQGLISVLILGISEPDGVIRSFSYIVAVAAAVEMILLFFLLLLPAQYTKAHIFVVVFYFCCTVLYAVMAGSYLYGQSNYNTVLSLVFGIIEWLLGFLILLLLVNPRFMNWARLHAENTGDGDKVIFRPKFFILAASEWAVLLINLLVSVVLVLGLYFIRN